MALTWDLSKIEDSDELWVQDGFKKVSDRDDLEMDSYWIRDGEGTGDDAFREVGAEEAAEAREKGVALHAPAYRIGGMSEVLIIMTIPVGMPTITRDNADEFFRRIQEVEKDGALMRSAGQDVYFTIEDIRKHIGLKTNASPVTKRSFDARMRKKAQERQKETA